MTESKFNVHNLKAFDMGDKFEIQVHDKSVVSPKEGTTIRKKTDISLLSEEQLFHYRQEQERQKQKYLRNKRTYMYRLVETNIAHSKQSCFFITLTFDPKKFNSDITNMEEINTQFKYFMRKANKWTKKKFHKKYKNYGDKGVIKYIAAPELHKDGKKVHFHVLMLFDQPTFLKIADVQNWWTFKGEQLGRIDVQCTNNMKNEDNEKVDAGYVANYITKYITKDLVIWHEMALQPIKISRNLKKPREIKYNLDLRKKKNFKMKERIKKILLKHDGFKYMQYCIDGKKHEIVRCYLYRNQIKEIPELQYLL